MCIQRRPFWIICCLLGSLLVLTRDINLKPKSGLPDPERSLSTCLPTQAIALQTRRWRRLSCTKTLVRSGQYFIFMVDSVAASSFVLFHATRKFITWKFATRIFPIYGMYLLWPTPSQKGMSLSIVRWLHHATSHSLSWFRMTSLVYLKFQ